MMDMGNLHYFLGIVVTRDSSSMHLSQSEYATKILDKAGMTSFKSAMTPINTSPKLTATADPPVVDPTEYWSLVGAL
jgi:hypothetical protein